MGTFTRIVHERVGEVTTITTHTMKGNFLPSEAFKALSRAHFDEQPTVEAVPAVSYVTADDCRSFYEPTMTAGYGHHNCRCAAPGIHIDDAVWDRAAKFMGTKTAKKKPAGLSRTGKRRVAAVRKRNAKTARRKK